MVSQMIASELRKRHPDLNITIGENHTALLVEGKTVYLNDIANQGVLEQFHFVSSPLQEEVLNKISERISSKTDFMDAKLNQEEPVVVVTTPEPVVEPEVAPAPETPAEETKEEVASEPVVEPETPVSEPTTEGEKPTAKKAKKS